MKTPAPDRGRSKGAAAGGNLTAQRVIETAMLDLLQEQDSMPLEQLVLTMSNHTWQEVLYAVEMLRRKAVLRVTQSDRLSYRISLNRPGSC